MKFRYIILLPVVAALLSMASCKDFLDKETDTRVTLNNVEQLRQLMVDAYPSSNYGLLGEFSSDNLIDNNAPTDAGVRYNLSSYNRNDDELFSWEDCRSESGSDSPSSVWESQYHAIAVCNAVLEKVAQFEAEGDNSDMLKAIKGEALVCRAYNHFILAQLFCMPYGEPNLSKPGIPYITAPETKVLVHYERGTVAETYDKIEADLVEGLPLINDGLYEIPKYHFNRQAANTFASRFYLQKREYEKVLEYANAAFGGADVDPSPYMSELWSQENLYYLSDFGRYYSNAVHPRNFMVISTYSTMARHFSGGRRYACNGEALRATVQGPGPSWVSEIWRSTGGGESFAMNPCFNGFLFVNGEREYGIWFGAPLGEQFEYTDKIAGIGYAHIVRTEFTGEEALFNRAEAKFFLGDIDGGFADLKVWEDAHRKHSRGYSGMRDFTKANVVSFYNDCEAKYVENLGKRAELAEKYSKSIMYGIAKPLHIDEICPSKYVVTNEIRPYLQCLLHFRRIENLHNGTRWFDIKRYGLSLVHRIGRSAQEVVLQTNDPRYALQIPNEVIAAGLERNERSVDVKLDEGSLKKFEATTINEQ